jgi:hypothetical protein
MFVLIEHYCTIHHAFHVGISASLKGFFFRSDLPLGLSEPVVTLASRSQRISCSVDAYFGLNLTPFKQQVAKVLDIISTYHTPDDTQLLGLFLSYFNSAHVYDVNEEAGIS